MTVGQGHPAFLSPPDGGEEPAPGGTRELWFNPIEFSGIFGYYAYEPWGEPNMYFSVYFPPEFVSINQMKVFFIGSGLFGPVNCTLNSMYGADGELLNIHTQSNIIPVNSTANSHYNFDVGSVFTLATAGDKAGLECVLPPPYMSSPKVLGLCLRYNV